MKNYEAEIVNRLLDTYERRGAYKKEPDEVRAITLSVEDVFPEYTNAYNHTAYQEINAAIGALKQKELITGSPRNEVHIKRSGSGLIRLHMLIHLRNGSHCVKSTVNCKLCWRSSRTAGRKSWII